MYTYSAAAVLEGSVNYPDITGEVIFVQKEEGVEVTARVFNLPPFSRENGKTVSPFGFHIHEGISCFSGSGENPFPKAGGHYNPDNQPHGNHNGDFPVLFPTTKGTAYLRFITDRFTVNDILGRVVVVHLSPDDYRTQPAGNTGEKIACGVIESARGHKNFLTRVRRAIKARLTAKIFLSPRTPLFLSSVSKITNGGNNPAYLFSRPLDLFRPSAGISLK